MLPVAGGRVDMDGTTCFPGFSTAVGGSQLLAIEDCVAPTTTITSTLAPNTPTATVSVFHGFDCADAEMGQCITSLQCIPSLLQLVVFDGTWWIDERVRIRNEGVRTLCVISAIFAGETPKLSCICHAATAQKFTEP
jgi:hypothetical protein